MSTTKKWQRSLQYGECMRNHACKLGSHAVDGCGEFIPSAASDPKSLTCAACGCHRSFHCRPDHCDSDKIEDEEEATGSAGVLLSLGNGGGVSKKKRVRSTFSKEQKEAMAELAERMGWRLRRSGDGVVEETCRRIGVEREVFKVWMHNNKQTFLAAKSRIANAEPAVAAAAVANANGGEKQQVNKSAAPSA